MSSSVKSLKVVLIPIKMLIVWLYGLYATVNVLLVITDEATAWFSCVWRWVANSAPVNFFHLMW